LQPPASNPAHGVALIGSTSTRDETAPAGTQARAKTQSSTCSTRQCASHTKTCTYSLLCTQTSAVSLTLTPSPSAPSPSRTLALTLERTDASPLALIRTLSRSITPVRICESVPSSVILENGSAVVCARGVEDERPAGVTEEEVRQRFWPLRYAPDRQTDRQIIDITPTRHVTCEASRHTHTHTLARTYTSDTTN
jgi:hypothetical protein